MVYRKMMNEITLQQLLWDGINLKNEQPPPQYLSFINRTLIFQYMTLNGIFRHFL